MPESHSTELAELVNRLTQELAESRRSLATAAQRLGTTSRSLEARTQELSEARAALALLLATLDSTNDGVLALGHFGRAMHYNSRFIDMWRIPPDKLAALNDSALLTMQLAQVTDPQRFLADVERTKSRPDDEHFSVIELTDGRIFEWQVVPQRVRGKRVGTVATYHDVTQRERLGRLVTVLEAELPMQVAEAKASTW
jgi:PAS domain-containing protein